MVASERRSGRSRSTVWLAAGAGALAGAAIVVVVLLATRSGGGGHHVTTSPTTAPAAPPGSLGGATTTTVALPKDPGARQLVEMLTGAQKLVFHARYSLQTPGSQASLELWRKPPLARRDTTATNNGKQVQLSELVAADSVVSCQRDPSGTWACIRTAMDPSHDPGDVAFGTLSRFLAEASYTVSDTTIGDRPARCFVGTAPLPAGATSTPIGSTPPPKICLTKDGIPLLIDAGDGPATATVIDSTVPDSTFTPPAKPVGG